MQKNKHYFSVTTQKQRKDPANSANFLCATRKFQRFKKERNYFSRPLILLILSDSPAAQRQAP
ncbi:MAG: hypothetical protein D3922_06720 [Candidatus Electrothrix sp. AR1]|nr:hypothetical protein [Candidatus Electrothrix sp. AR1]